MIGYLRGVRDYNDAIVHGRGKDAVVDILTRYTAVKDPQIYTQMTYAGVAPDGRIRPEILQMDVQYYRAKGFIEHEIDVQQVVDNRFTDYAVSHLGPYRPSGP